MRPGERPDALRLVDDSMNTVPSLESTGVCVLSGVFGEPVLRQMRRDVLANLPLTRNTRPNPASRHLAGFHRYPSLAPLHELITSNDQIVSAMRQLLAPSEPIVIGLSDITINRSQQWHTDLLRGKYSAFLDPETCWAVPTPQCIKVLVYLQSGPVLSN
jgi:hypothetical protein